MDRAKQTKLTFQKMIKMKQNLCPLILQYNCNDMLLGCSEKSNFLGTAV